MKLIRVSAHMGGPGSRRYDHCTDPFAARGERGVRLHAMRWVSPKTCDCAPKKILLSAWSPKHSPSQTFLLPGAFTDGGFRPLLDFSGVKASIFTRAAPNYECVGGREFLITKTNQSRLENRGDVHYVLL